jgi:hypothetical protein
MTTPLDDAMATAATAEATYLADLRNLDQIKTSIETATSPLAPAQTQTATDAAAYKQTLVNLARLASEAADAL